MCELVYSEAKVLKSKYILEVNSGSVVWRSPSNVTVLHHSLGVLQVYDLSFEAARCKVPILKYLCKN